MNRKSLVMLLCVISIIATGATLLWMTLSPPVRLFEASGVVTDGKTGQPVAGAEISVDGFKCLTREDGAYTISSIPLGTYILKVLMEGYDAHEESVTVKQDLTLNMILTPSSATVMGKVTSGETVLPVVNATVTANGYKATTGPDGVYSLSVDVGSYNVTVSIDGYETKTVSVDASEGKTYTIDISITPIGPLTIKLTADPYPLIIKKGEIGTIVITAVLERGDGKPAAGVTMHFRSRMLPGEFDSQTAITDANGVATVRWTYRAEEIPEHVAVLITASATVEGQLISAELWVGVSRPCEECHGFG